MNCLQVGTNGLLVSVMSGSWLQGDAVFKHGQNTCRISLHQLYAWKVLMIHIFACCLPCSFFFFSAVVISDEQQLGPGRVLLHCGPSWLEERDGRTWRHLLPQVNKTSLTRWIDKDDQYWYYCAILLNYVVDTVCTSVHYLSFLLPEMRTETLLI